MMGISRTSDDKDEEFSPSQVSHMLDASMSRSSSPRKLPFGAPIRRIRLRGLKIEDQVRQIFEEPGMLTDDLVEIHIDVNKTTEEEERIPRRTYLPEDWCGRISTFISDPTSYLLSLRLLNLKEEIGDESAIRLSSALLQNNTLIKLALVNANITNEGSNHIAKLLLVNTSIRKVTLEKNKIDDSGCIALSKVIAENTTIERFNLAGNAIHSSGALMLSSALSKNNSIRKFVIRRNKIRSDGACAFAEMLLENKTLTNLDLSINKISDRGTLQLAESLKLSKSSLHVLGFEKNQASGEALSYLLESLSFNSTITKIYLSNNNLSGLRANALEKFVSNNKSTKELYMSSAILSDMEELYLLNAMCFQHCYISKLNLQKNSLKNLGAKKVSEILRYCHHLSNLNLEENEIGAEGAYYLAESIRDSKTIRKINLSKNCLKSEGASHLIEVLKKNTSLESLLLNENQIGDACGAQILEATLIHPKLLRLEMIKNDLEVECATKLVKILRNESTLEILNLRSNCLGKGLELYSMDSFPESQSNLKFLNLGKNRVSDAGALILSRYLSGDTGICELMLDSNRIGDLGATEICEGVLRNSTITRLNLRHNRVTSVTQDRILRMLVSNYSLQSCPWTSSRSVFPFERNSMIQSSWKRTNFLLLFHPRVGLHRLSEIRHLLDHGCVRLILEYADLHLNIKSDELENNPLNSEVLIGLSNRRNSRGVKIPSPERPWIFNLLGFNRS